MTTSEASTEVPPRSQLSRWLAIGAGAIGLALILLLAFSDADGRDDQAEVVGKVAPPIVGTDIDGNPFDLDDLRGRWVVVNFFATWCPPCIQEHPELVSFSEAHADRSAEVVSVVFDRSDADATVEFFEREGGNWPVLADDTGPVSIDYGVVSVPETFLVDPFGIVRAKINGGVTRAGLDTMIARLTGESP